MKTSFRITSLERLGVVFVLLFVFTWPAIALEPIDLVLLEADQPASENGLRGTTQTPQTHEASELAPATLQSPIIAKSQSSLRYAIPTTNNILSDLHDALATMQDEYFSLWLGKWTTAIDWTAAVMSTYLSATLSSLSHSIDYIMPGTFDRSKRVDVEAQMVEDEVNRYFAQTSAFYFGEEAFSIRMQAYDDILWVVLEWLESIQFIGKHAASHHATNDNGHGGWHAQQFIPAFAHRARIFYELAEKGWDWRLCGGGLTWNPRLLPYKNAITNQLFISASISMYLNFPGDDNCSPVLSSHDSSIPPDEAFNTGCDDDDVMDRGRYDPTFLASAKNGYDWLKNSGMINAQGLYADGFHISGYRENRSKTICDERNEMVYTYNQGVVLSGLRGLWEGTGNITYLEDGHELVRNVIRATGWKDGRMFEEPVAASGNKWHGLGSKGILMEACDPSGSCNQNGQTFKGIFFHHLTAFCTPLPRQPVKPGKTHGATKEIAALHQSSCNSYIPWVIHNAQSALATRDEKGRFGAWWAPHHTTPSPRIPNPTESTFDDDDDDEVEAEEEVFHLPQNAIDHQNHPSLLSQLDIHHAPNPDNENIEHTTSTSKGGKHSPHVPHERQEEFSTEQQDEENDEEKDDDPNTRGRGRTVETQGSGISVVRAMWEFVRRS